VPSYDQPGYTLYDASLGISKDAWTAQIFAQNLTNVLASTFTNSPQWIEQEAVTRPRVAGLKFSYKF
jgi:outer membrane receptor protein involved in Fe transport